jgi:outer membrane autotransporter protein
MTNKLMTASAQMLLVLVVSSGISTKSFADTVGFSGDFAPGNWTFSNSAGSTGSVDTTSAPNSIQLTGSDGASSTSKTASYTIVAPSDGTVSFSWSYVSSDIGGIGYDNPKFNNNEILTNVTGFSQSGSLTQSGAASYDVTLGTVFGFVMDAVDNYGGSAYTIFSNFLFTPDAPDWLLELGGDTLTPNARAVAAAIDAAVDGGFDPEAFADLYTQAESLNGKLAELSGELHSAERRVALEDTRVVREAALDRLGYGLTTGADATAVAGDSAFWVRDVVSRGTADADGTGSRATTDQAGFLMGADFVQGNVKYGGMFSYTNTNVDLGSLGSSETRSTGAAIYAGYRQDSAGLAFAAGGAFASTSATGERSIGITDLEQTLTSRVEGTSYQVFGEVSNDLAKAGNVQIEPFARLAYAKVKSDAFAETGGSAALSGAKQSNDLRMASFGLRGAYVKGKTTLSGSAAWVRSAGDLSAPTTLSMAGVNTPYEVNAAALDQAAVELAAQASVHLSPDMTLAGGYNGMIGKNNATHGLGVTLSVAW